VNREPEGSDNVPMRRQALEPSMTRARKLTDLISMRLSPEDSKELDVVCERLPMPRLTVARIALRIGLSELRENPARILEGESKRPQRAKARRR
jgi:hypothetical protein